jgi:hypothetical protein
MNWINQKHRNKNDDSISLMTIDIDNDKEVVPSVSVDLKNDDDDDSNEVDVFSKIINTKNDLYIFDLEDNKDINLQTIMQFNTDSFKKRITNIRQLMKDNMTKSGTHNNDPFNFAEAAMRHYPGYTKISVNYFYVRCEENPGVESQFVTFLDESLKGDTTTLCSSNGKEQSSVKKRKEGEEDSIQHLLEQGNKMLKIMTESAIDRKKQMSDTAKNWETSKRNKQKRADFLARIELAKALGDKDEIEMNEAKEAKEANENQSE